MVFCLPGRKYREGFNISADELRLHKDYLQESNFRLWLLDEKSDEEINKLIDIAKDLGDLEKAEILSRVLLERHLS